MKNPWKEILIAFLIGALAGGFLVSRVQEKPRGQWKKGQMLNRISQKLNLDAEQKEQVGKILVAKREQFAALRSEMKPKFEEIRNSSKMEIQKILTPEQQVKFAEIEAKWQARWQRKTRNAGF